MFKNLKISTGLYFLVGMFVVFIFILSSVGIFNLVSVSGDLGKIIQASDRSKCFQMAVYNLNRGIIDLNSLMLDRGLKRPLDNESVMKTRNFFAEARKNMDQFVAIPGTTPGAQAATLDAKDSFDALLALSLDKFNQVTTSGNDLGDLSSFGWKIGTQKELSGKISAYLDSYNDAMLGHKARAESHIYWVVVLAGIIIFCSILGVVVSRAWLRKTIFERLDYTKMHLQTIAAGDLSQKVNVEAKNEIGLMLVELDASRYALTKTVRGIRTNVTQIYGNVREIVTNNNDLASRTEQQVSALQQTAASMEELKITVRHNADNAHSAKQLAEVASNSAHKGSDVMTGLGGIMRVIADNSRQIADINSVIDSIANQTNILALNAAVEAARAGEQGRGFAVVAGEVRNLAKRSADAAKEIRQLINTCVTNMNTGSQEVEQASAAMHEIVTSVAQVTDIMAEIASASEEQSTGINQIAQAVDEIDLVTQQNATMEQQVAKVAREVESHTGELDQIVAKFVIGDDVITGGNTEKRPTEHVLSSIPNGKGERKSGGDNIKEQWETF